MKNFILNIKALFKDMKEIASLSEVGIITLIVINSVLLMIVLGRILSHFIANYPINHTL